MTLVNVLCYNRKAMVAESILKNARIIQSFRRSIGFEVVEDGTLVLRVPYGVSRQELERVVAKKKNGSPGPRPGSAGSGKSIPPSVWRRGNSSCCSANPAPCGSGPAKALPWKKGRAFL